MFSSESILIVTGDPMRSARLVEITSRLGLLPICCGTLSAAKALVGNQRFSMMFCDDVLPNGDFRDVIPELSRSDIPVIVMSKHGDDWDSYLKVMKAGAFDYVLLPPQTSEVERISGAAIRRARAKATAA